MTEELTHLREQISLTRAEGRARYSDAVRSAVLELLARWRGTGKPRSALADALGLDGSTLAGWEKQAPKGKSKVKAVTVVDVASVAAGPVAVVVLPSGVRIEAMTSAAAVEIARALA